ncbi:CPBP family intramembrane glutamic endopeptidase [Rhodococcus sp. NPDC049939]|uniref:CPBP family intramembrane glutamic endopeptidase n=1 Tax=Rhodococcus sp. NPDC049939 TaxID=3155511 RepID=UPI0033F217E8
MTKLASVAGAAATVVWNNVILPRSGLGPTGRAVAGGAFGLAAVASARSAGYGVDELGLSVTKMPAGLRYGTAASALPIAGYVTALSVSALRKRVPPRQTSPDLAGWVLFRIPVGTVVHEELVFRSALSAILGRSWPSATARVLHATTFGLWHIRAARISEDSVAGTLLVTCAFAWLLDWLRRRSGSVVAPALLHLSVNVAGAIVVESMRRRAH